MATCSRCGNDFATNGPPPPAGASVVCPRCAATSTTVASTAQFINRPPQGGTNTLGIIGFIFSIIGIFTGIFLIPGLILSLFGLRKKPRGLAIGGMVVGAAGLLFWGLLLAILILAMGRAKIFANRAIIAVDERMIVQQCIVYGQSNDAQFPPHLANLVAGGKVLPGNLVCPIGGHIPLLIPDIRAHNVAWIRIHLRKHCDFVYVGRGLTTNAGSNDIVIYTNPAITTLGPGLYVGFADGHTTWIPAARVSVVFARANKMRHLAQLPPLPVPTLAKP